MSRSKPVDLGVARIRRNDDLLRGLSRTWAFLKCIGVNMELSGEVIGRLLAAALLFGAIGPA